MYNLDIVYQLYIANVTNGRACSASCRYPVSFGWFQMYERHWWIVLARVTLTGYSRMLFTLGRWGLLIVTACEWYLRVQQMSMQVCAAKEFQPKKCRVTQRLLAVRHMRG